ncbi:hypothetical protein [Streptomyces sp. SAS_270]|uniref:hypothetical protein n=1 Tax=Streptomyces sp. SAS_270 TaxID=3412748 RepID=UPI00403C8371
MRGLGTGARQVLKAGSTAAAALTALGLLTSGCATGGTGARDEGPAHDADTVAAAPTPSASVSASASASPAQAAKRVDAVKLIQDDPKVSASVKGDLKPCVGDEYPVDVSYGELTGGSASDIVVNVMTCGDAVGVGSYVYRRQGSGYQNVFKAEEPPVYAEIDRGDLVVTQQLYEKGDPVTYPSSEEVITYSWATTHFKADSRTRNNYSNAVGGTDTATPDAG